MVEEVISGKIAAVKTSDFNINQRILLLSIFQWLLRCLYNLLDN